MRVLAHPVAKPLVFLLYLLPAAWLFWAAASDQLGANPAEALIRGLGDWTLRALVLVLAVTPLRVSAGWALLARLRRMAGLFVFFYASLHWLAYAWLDMGFVWADIVADVPKRPFILVGTLGWLLLLALAVTSFNRAIRWLGAARWQRLHRAVYAVAVLAVLHFFWMRAARTTLPRWRCMPRCWPACWPGGCGAGGWALRRRCQRVELLPAGTEGVAVVEAGAAAAECAGVRYSGPF